MSARDDYPVVYAHATLDNGLLRRDFEKLFDELDRLREAVAANPNVRATVICNVCGLPFGALRNHLGHWVIDHHKMGGKTCRGTYSVRHQPVPNPKENA